MLHLHQREQGLLVTMDLNNYKPWCQVQYLSLIYGTLPYTTYTELIAVFVQLGLSVWVVMYLLDSTSAFYLLYTVHQPVGYGWLLSNSWQNIKSWNQSTLQRNSRQEFYKYSVSAVYSFLFYLPKLMLTLQSCQISDPSFHSLSPYKKPRGSTSQECDDVNLKGASHREE